jgi:hypothetical protein
MSQQECTDLQNMEMARNARPRVDPSGLANAYLSAEDRAELMRYRERESVHIRPLLSAMRAYLLFPGAPETPSTADMFRRIDQASAFSLSASAAEGDESA